MRTIVVTSLKGGVGKSTCSSELIKALHRTGLRVGGLDVDYRAPNLPFFFGLDSPDQLRRGHEDSLIPPKSAEGIPIFSLHFMWPPGQAVMVGNEEAMLEVAQMLQPKVIDWGEPLDYLVVDTPPDSVGTIAVVLKATDLWGCVVVCQPSRVSRTDAERTISLLREVSAPVLGLIINQAYLWPDHSPLFDLTEQDIRAMAAEKGIHNCWAVPHRRDGLGPFFDKIVRQFQRLTPEVLPKPVLREEPWNELMAISRLLNGLLKKQNVRS